MTDWDRLVRQHGPTVYRTAWRILGHVADTEDVTQEVFLEVSQLANGEPVRHWAGLLRRLAAFRALDRLRQRKQTVPLDDLHLASANGDPEEEAVARELAERLRAVVAHLPQREGAVFCLRYFDDLTNEQIAELLHISSGAVAAALHKARAKVETLLAEAPTGEPS
jgi:RNA polymerase sigma-70 factor (ECF subfamily)